MQEHRCFARLIAAALFVLSLTVHPFVHAQTVTTGAITGTVTDPSGAAIPGVTVTATEKATGATRTAETDASGSYRINLLPPGEYALQFTGPGFKTLVPPPVKVVVTEISTLNVQMVLGEKRETVEVTASAQVVQSQSATLGTVVENHTITEIPLSTRNYTQALTMSPGVIADVNNSAELGKGTQDVYVNGASNISNNFQMDGTDANNFGSGRAGTFLQQGGIPIPNPDAIQEFKVQTTLFDAGYGRGAGANVDVVTKSGSNELHGSVFEFFRNDVLNANDFFLNQNNQPRPVMKQNQFGGPRQPVYQGPRLLFRFLPENPADQRAQPQLVFQQFPAAAHQRPHSRDAGPGVLHAEHGLRRRAGGLRWLEHQSRGAEAAKYQASRRNLPDSYSAEDRQWRRLLGFQPSRQLHRRPIPDQHGFCAVEHAPTGAALLLFPGSAGCPVQYVLLRRLYTRFGPRR